MMVACSGDVEMTSVGKGNFSLGLSTDGVNVDVVTRAAHELTESEAAEYTIILRQGENLVWTKNFTDITGPDCTQPLGTDYIVSAENCTIEEAEGANEGWGQRRIAGESEPFAIVTGDTTAVMVNCSVQNAGLCVMFDKSFTDYFSEYAVTTDDLRALKFNATNAAEFDVNRQLTHGTIAYYNVESNGKHMVNVIISASAGWDGTVRLTRSLTLQSGRITRLRVHLGDDPLGSVSSISITYSDVFDESEEEILLED